MNTKEILEKLKIEQPNAKDYQYALIGSSTDKYLWILSRTPELPEPILDKLLENIKQRGYDLSKLVFVDQ